MQCSRIQCSAVQCSAVQYSAVQVITYPTTVLYYKCVAVLPGPNTELSTKLWPQLVKLRTTAPWHLGYSEQEGTSAKTSFNFKKIVFSSEFIQIPKSEQKGICMTSWCHSHLIDNYIQSSFLKEGFSHKSIFKVRAFFWFCELGTLVKYFQPKKSQLSPMSLQYARETLI